MGNPTVVQEEEVQHQRLNACCKQASIWEQYVLIVKRLHALSFSLSFFPSCCCQMLHPSTFLSSSSHWCRVWKRCGVPLLESLLCGQVMSSADLLLCCPLWEPSTLDEALRAACASLLQAASPCMGVFGICLVLNPTPCSCYWMSHLVMISNCKGAHQNSQKVGGN